LLSLDENRGKGGAVKQGMQHAAGQYVLFMDADSSTKITEFEKFRPRLEEGCEVVIGTRRSPRSDVVVQQPGHRQFMGRVFTRLACLLLGLRVSDITCGFKCFRRDVAQALCAQQTINGWAFDAELLFLAHRWNLRIAEVPVTWLNEPGTKVRPFRDAVTSLTELLRIRRNDRQGRYERRGHGN
jgi:dolichyl-phosphate beta-glucosyltransferase